MIILAYVWFSFLILMTVFMIVAGVIEHNLEESHPVMKWWRRNVIAPDPYDKNPHTD